MPLCLDDKLPGGLSRARIWLNLLPTGLLALAELGKIWAFVQTRQRKTVLLFFGDRLPALTEPFETPGFDDGRKPYEQPSVFLVLVNFPLVSGLPAEMPMHQLLLRTLAASGVPLSENYRNMLAAHDIESSSLTPTQREEPKNWIEQPQLMLPQSEAGPDEWN